MAIRDGICITTDSKTGQRVVDNDIPSARIRQRLERITGSRTTVDPKQPHCDALLNTLKDPRESGFQGIARPCEPH